MNGRYFGVRERTNQVRQDKVGFLDIQSMDWRETRS